MHAPQISFFDWQRQFATEEDCLRHLARLRWPDGFQCPSCGHDHGCFLKSRRLYECTHCSRQTSVTAATLFHATKLLLTKWYWAIYWIAADKGSLSALRLTKLIGVSWPTAFAMLRKLRQAMGHRDTLYRLSEIIELDDALSKLAGFDQRKSDILELHYFAGMTYDEIASALEVSSATVDRDLRFSKAWLAHELRDD